MAKVIILIISTLIVFGCGDNAVDGNTICGKMEKRLFADDVYGTGYYSERRQEFEEATGCTTVFGCTESMVIREEVCLDDIEVR